MASSYRLTLDNWLSQLEVKAGTVLDIGGAQLPLPKRVKSWDVQEYVIADLPVPHADSPKPDVELDMNEWDQTIVGYADMIFCLEVFEYIWNPVAAMENIAANLKPKGTAWVTFPSFYPLHQPVTDDALRYMPAGIRKLAACANLEIVHMIERRPETSALRQFFSAERMRAAKGEDHDFTGFIVELRK